MLANRIRMSGSETEIIVEYVLATDDDFSGTSNGQFRYIGTDEYVEIPHVIKGVPVNSYLYMFQDNVVVKGVKSTNLNIDSTNYMFFSSQTTSLNLSSFDTSGVTNMDSMFRESQATRLDLSSFDTSSVTRMNSMFRNSQATSLNLSSFDTSSVTNMGGTFAGSQATILDLSSFDTSSLTSMNIMFEGSQATIGYARTQADADKFNNTSNKPTGLTFIVKPEE